MAERRPKSLAGTIVKTFMLDAPVDRVYRAFTDQRDLEEWLAEPYAIDVKPGGAFAFGQVADGHTTSGEFLEVLPKKRLVYTWHFAIFDPRSRKAMPNWSEVEKAIGETSFGHMFTLELEVSVDGKVQTIRSPQFLREEPMVIST